MGSQTHFNFICDALRTNTLAEGGGGDASQGLTSGGGWVDGWVAWRDESSESAYQSQINEM